MSESLDLRVTVLDAWDAIPLLLSGQTSLAEMKRLALDAARVIDPPSDFLVKFRGTELRDESQSLADAAIPTGGALIVMRRHRRAVH